MLISTNLLLVYLYFIPKWVKPIYDTHEVLSERFDNWISGKKGRSTVWNKQKKGAEKEENKNVERN